MYYELIKLNKGNKKFKVITPSNKTIYFGARGYSDYTIHKNPIRKRNYIARHRKNENWNNLNSAGAWSRWILWEKTNLNSAIDNMENKFNIHIIY